MLAGTLEREVPSGLTCDSILSLTSGPEVRPCALRHVRPNAGAFLNWCTCTGTCIALVGTQPPPTSPAQARLCARATGFLRGLGAKGGGSDATAMHPLLCGLARVPWPETQKERLGLPRLRRTRRRVCGGNPADRGDGSDRPAPTASVRVQRLTDRFVAAKTSSPTASTRQSPLWQPRLKPSINGTCG